MFLFLPATSGLNLKKKAIHIHYVCDRPFLGRLHEEITLLQNHPNSTDVNGRNIQNDEIDILGLMRAVIKTWRAWLLSILIASLVFGAIKMVEILTLTPETVYSKPIRLMFPNAHKREFPSGAKFAHGDIIAPAIAQQVFERNKLNNYGLTVAEFQRGLSASSFSPSYPLILERYNRRLSDKRLTMDAIAELQKQMEEEINQATAGEVLISWRLSKYDIPREIAEKVLTDLPALWAEKAVKERGVLEIKAQLTTAKSLNLPLIKREEILIAGDILSDKLKLLKKNIDELSTFEGSQSISDPKTGMRLSDLTNALSDLNNFVIGSVLAPVRLQGLTEAPELSTYYYTDKLNQLNIKLSEKEYQATALRDSYRQFNKNSGLGSGDNGNGQLLAPQLNTDMLDKLASLSGDLEREKYNQKLNDQWLILTREVSEIRSKIAETKQLLSSLKDAKNTEQSTADGLALARNRLPEILDQVVEYFEVSERIGAQLGADALGVNDKLFTPVTSAIIESRERVEIKTLLLTWLAILFLTTVVVIPTVMIRNALKPKVTIG